MKKRITAVSILLFCVTVMFAQAPEKFTYQVVVRNAGNALVTDAQVCMRVSILQGSADGLTVYVETHTANTNANGLLTLEIGGGKAEQGEFDDIDWANGPYFLKTETDPNGGSDYSVTITQQLLSVPYALYAKKAANSFSGDYNDLKNKPTIPQNVGELGNDAGYITLNDLPSLPKGGNNDAGSIQTTVCGEIDLCDLLNRIAQMEATLLPTISTNAVCCIMETTAICGGNVTNNGYCVVTGRGVCWDTVPNPTVDGNHTSNGTETGDFASSILGLTTNTTYYVRAYVSYRAGTAYGTMYGEEVRFTTSGTCSITLPYSENFDGYTSSTTAETGVQPDCWVVISDDVSLTNATKPQVYRGYATSGDYSLRMKNRCVYAMPDLDNNINIQNLTMTFNVRQAKAVYRLQVGVINDNGGFEVVKTINNTSTNTEHVMVDFSNYTGDGHRIAFRNTVSSSSTLDYSINYIDDIELGYSSSCGIRVLPYTENFDGFTTSTTTGTGVQPDCWEVITEDVALTNATKPQVYCGYASSGNYSLRMKNRCVYAMPALDNQVNIQNLTMTFNVRQPNAIYRLQVGIVNENGVFEVVKTINNASTEIEKVTVDFSNYTGNGHRIAFHNTLVSGSTIAYSINYIDDIVLDFRDGLPCNSTPMVTDHEGNIYNTVKIGGQCWTKENLRTTTSPSTGTCFLQDVNTDYTYTGKYALWIWGNGHTPLVFGLLYNWNAAVDTFNNAYGETSVNTDENNAVSISFSGHRRGICPAGWHLPSDAEWTQLTDYVGSVPEHLCDGEIAKALASTTEWNTSTNNCAVGNDQSVNNTTGFSAIPAGYCNGSSGIYGTHNTTIFWSSTENEDNSATAYSRQIYLNNAYVNRDYGTKKHGRSVRCLRN